MGLVCIVCGVLSLRGLTSFEGTVINQEESPLVDQ